MRALVLVFALLFADPALATAIGITNEVDIGRTSVWSIDPVARTMTPLSSAGLLRMRGIARRSDGVLFAIGQRDVFVPEYQTYFTYNYLAQLDSFTGVAQPSVLVSDSFHGITFSPSGTLFALNKRVGSTSALWTIDEDTGAAAYVGETSFVSVATLVFAPTGQLYAWDGFKGLLQIDPLTGSATRITQGADNLVQINALSFAPGGGLVGFGREVFDIDLGTGVATSRGGFTNAPATWGGIRGVASLPEPTTQGLMALSLLAFAATRLRRAT